MKTFSAGIAAAYASRASYIAVALKITQQVLQINGSFSDGDIFGFTSLDEDVTIDGVLYESTPGLNATAVEIAANAAVGNMELEVLHDNSIFTMVDVRNGKWSNAKFIIFRFKADDLTAGTDVLLSGNLGEATINDNSIVIELRDKRQYLQQPIGALSSPTCRARLGDNMCGVALGASPVNSSGSPPQAWIVTGAVTSVTSNQIFRDSARTEDTDWFGNGLIRFDSGNNEGVWRAVYFFEGGTFTTALPFYGDVQVGDRYTAVVGCRKRLEDCRDKFNNVLNFQGEPHRNGIDNLTKLVN